MIAARLRRFTCLSAAAGILAGCGVLTQAAIMVGGSAAEQVAQRLDPAARCATDLVRRPDGTWWRCGQLESMAAELADAAAAAEGAGYWP